MFRRLDRLMSVALFGDPSAVYSISAPALTVGSSRDSEANPSIWNSAPLVVTVPSDTEGVHF